MNSTVFKGANVFMSRNLVPPEDFDALHDTLKRNGAQVFLCCDPSRNGPDDFHVISSMDHEKFEDLLSKGCNLIGPRCIRFCANECRKLPSKGFTCCFAMEGVKVLASGFAGDEKLKIRKLVKAMGGVFQEKASMDVNIVIVKNVLAAKYWMVLELYCKDQFSILSGVACCLTIWFPTYLKVGKLLVHGRSGDVDVAYGKAILAVTSHTARPGPHQKGSINISYSLIPATVESFRVQPFSGLTISVTRIPAACLNEESYHIQGSSASTRNAARIKNQHSLESGIQSVHSFSSTATVSNSEAVSFGHAVDSDMGGTFFQNAPSFSEEPLFSKEERNDHPIEHQNYDAFTGEFVAGDSQTDDNDLYLSDCRLLIVGFSASEMRKLVNMVRKGGGSRYMYFSEKLTHIIVGSPSEIEIKEIRNLSALGVIHVVKPDWLADCTSQKKEVPVLQKHIASDLFLPREHIKSNKGVFVSNAIAKQGNSSEGVQCHKDFESGNSLKESKEVENINNKGSSQIEIEPQFCTLNGKDKAKSHTNLSGADQADDDTKTSTVFKGKRFCFSSCFPADQRGDIILWVNQGGGELVEAQIETDVHFVIERHGVMRSQTDAGMTYVSSHWIKSCLEDGRLLDVGSHICYSPLPCQVPFPAFKSFRLGVSQYDEKEKKLLRNLCFILGAKFAEKFSRRATHLLCKFTCGQKYEFACRFGIQPVTCEWIYECIKQNKVVAPGPFYPKAVTSENQEAAICTASQFPTQAAQMLSEDVSQVQNESKELETMHNEAFTARSATDITTSGAIPPENRKIERTKDCVIMSDVANLIEDCLEHTNKIKIMEINSLLSDCLSIGQTEASSDRDEDAKMDVWSYKFGQGSNLR
ncbi:unnamed protein product [Cuscuta campestris]|uniref:BRCT domain-containing protein n=1 Tax=Cuscuta campestris TaxID=132261 RepID=A0A484MT48_9ASTE|nr:unnamed protein product [Cuscuta campestris]